MEIKLSILICTLKSRFEYFNELMLLLIPQKTSEIEILSEIDSGEMTIGEKRTKLMNLSKGEYIAFIDDDDEVSKDYVSKILKAIESKPDCTSLTGVITHDGINPELFCHSIKYKQWQTNTNNEPIKYERNPNHLNAIKRDIAIKYSFIPVNHGEDQDWSMRIQNELKTETEIEGVIYHYKYISNK